MLLRNAFFAFLEKIFALASQLIVTVILVRSLPIEQYALLGAAAGVMALVGFFNIALEAQIIKDHSKWDLSFGALYYLRPYFVVALIKIIIFAMAAHGLALLLGPTGHESNFRVAIFAVLIPFSVDALVAPVSVYTSCQLKQDVVAKATLLRSLMNVGGTAILLWRPEIFVLVIKELVTGVMYILIWVYIGKHSIESGMRTESRLSVISQVSKIIVEARSYSLWIHANGVVTNLVYRSHTLILSKFAPLADVGAYTIALNCANIANVVPALLGSQQSIVLSKAETKQRIREVCRVYGATSIVLSIFMVGVFVVFGKYYIRIVTGDYSSLIYEYMIWISLSLIFVKSIASPAIAYLNIFGSAKRIVTRIAIPLLIVAASAFVMGSYGWMGRGLAVSNMLVSFVWLFLVSVECRKFGYEITSARDVMAVIASTLRRIRYGYGSH